MQQQLQHELEVNAGSSGSSSLASRLSPQPGIGRTMTRPSPTPPSTPVVQQFSIEATDDDISVHMTPVAFAGEGASGVGLVIGDIAAPDPVIINQSKIVGLFLDKRCFVSRVR